MPRDWAEELIEDAVMPDGSHREIRLPSMLRKRGDLPPPSKLEVSAALGRAAERGRVILGPAEWRCRLNHLVWKGPPGDAGANGDRRCPACDESAPHLLEETFTIPDAVAREVATRRRA